MTFMIVSVVSGVYHAGIAALLDYTQMDRKIFNFKAPKTPHAFAYGALSYVSLTLGKAIVHNLLSTRFESESARGMHHGNDQVTLYRLGNVAAYILALFGSAYLLNQMNYRIPYRFTPISLIPFVLNLL